MKFLLLCLLMPVVIHAQWPGYFYAFTLTDKAGQIIIASNKDYTFNIIKPAKSDIMLKVLMCDDSTTIRFYVGGYHGLDETHKLEIVKTTTKEKMIIVFPSALSGGDDNYYRDLFVGNLSFRKVIYQVKLPAADSAWNSLQEKHFCPDYGGADSYWDISSFQKE